MNTKKLFLPVLAVVLTFASVPVTLVEAQIPTPTTHPVPVHLTISNAKVDTHIIPVGITKQGNLDVPPNYTEAGWYKYGKLPGEIGSVVLDGHVDNGGKIPGPFKHLRDLKIGDEISVEMSDGSTFRYKVTLSEVYDTDKFPGEKVFHETGKEYLKIITCHGTYVSKKGTYDQRLIITAVRIP